ncbi:hypothetical protein IW261DRAFT_1562554 [Armillaria novae-zelandiae]|uniref:Nephrocystin 3-like N-terminal domain-containing protein n=1 Tax=Armillaria novae-zelandiae TaxID=153914 RepID=A0AA39PBR9_9AGAR|nr:hypothetical protein IW261DRAFT_1562554 [Armillaria novae-zelandiae]
MSAVATTSISANEANRILYILEAEIVKIAPTRKSKFCLKITAGEKKHKTEEIKIDGGGAMPKWTVNIGDIDLQTKVVWKLYGRRRLPLKVVGCVNKTLGEAFEGGSTSTDIQLYDGTSEITILRISGSNSAEVLMNQLVPSVQKPSENFQFLKSSEALEKVFDTVKGMIDTLAGAHPAATIAWGLLSVGFEVLQNQHDTNQAVINLYAEMISVYEEASKDNILQHRDGLHGTYSSLFKQTIECALFIEGYAKKSGIGCLFTLDISGKAKEFLEAFDDLKDQLTRGLARESVIITLGVQELVNIQIMRDLLRDLHPSIQLRAKSSCTPGTRVETINMMVSWIAKCNGEVMWCNGMAGTGKSSLMGTLHDLLTAHIGGRSRLAAFIRYDHIQYKDASKLFTSIAYALGMFDDRIGMAISKVIQTSRTVVTMSDLSDQFRLLLREPLESVLELCDEGPLVIIVDGLDESNVSNASKEVVAVLAEGFGQTLPFIRLIVSSRPVHHIDTVFRRQHGVYPLHLDISSESVNRDIRFYLEQEFATVKDSAFQEKCRELHAIDKLAERASGLFIWAATVAKFVCAFPTKSRLQALLTIEIPNDAIEALTTLYHTALNTIVSEIPGANADIKKYVCDVLGAVLAAKTPPGMTEVILDTLILDEDSPPSSRIVSMLGSVLTPETNDSPIQLIHKSFDDFLQNQSQSGDDWFVDVMLHQQKIAKQCLDASILFLKKWSSQRNRNIIDVPVHISQYALFGLCWHITAFNESGLELLASFFHFYFLPWLDVHLCVASTSSKTYSVFRNMLKVLNWSNQSESTSFHKYCCSVLDSMLMVLNWSNQFGSTQSRTLFYHAYMFANRAIHHGGQSHLDPSYIHTVAMSLSPSNNVICKAWEQANIIDSAAVFSDKERLLVYMDLKSRNDYILFSDSLITSINTPSHMMTHWKIDTGQQQSSSVMNYSLFGQAMRWSHSIILHMDVLQMSELEPECIVLPLHDDYVSHETIFNSSYHLHISFFDSQTQVFKVYTLSLSSFSEDDFNVHSYNKGFVLAHKVGFFMKITTGQEDNFAWIPIPMYKYLSVCEDGSIIALHHHDDTIQLYDTQTDAAVFDPVQIHADEHIFCISDDGSKMAFRNFYAMSIRAFDMTLGRVTNVFKRKVDDIMFVGVSKIAYICNKQFIIQSFEKDSVLLCYDFSLTGSEYDRIRATQDGARVVIYDFHGSECMVWDAEDL